MDFFGASVVSDRCSSPREDEYESAECLMAEEGAASAAYSLLNMDSGSVVRTRRPGDPGLLAPDSATWWKGASGQELMMGHGEGRGGVVLAESVPGMRRCAICADGALKDALQDVVQTGDPRKCSEVLSRLRPELDRVDVILDHMSHGMPTETDCDASMLRSLMLRSYNMAMALGEDYAASVVTATGQRCCWVNKGNIAGFTAAGSMFLKFLKAKQGLGGAPRGGGKRGGKL